VVACGRVFLIQSINQSTNQPIDQSTTSLIKPQVHDRLKAELWEGEERSGRLCVTRKIGVHECMGWECVAHGVCARGQ
jgi:hypothetical protein